MGYLKLGEGPGSCPGSMMCGIMRTTKRCIYLLAQMMFYQPTTFREPMHHKMHKQIGFESQVDIV